MSCVLALDLGGTRFRAALVNGAGHVAHACHIDSPAGASARPGWDDIDADAWWRGLQTLADTLAAQAGPAFDAVQAVAVCGVTRTQIFGRRWGLEDMIAAYLRQVRAAAPFDLGARAVVGRPVRYWGAEEAADDERAVGRMRDALTKAGFTDVVFEYEPVGAAAFAGLKATVEAGRIEPDEDVLAINTGNGLKDISAAQRAAGRAGRIEPSMAALQRSLAVLRTNG